MLCRLVAHHSCAIIEAGERGLANVLSAEFEPAPYMLSSVLTFCDMTTSPDGELVPVEKRLAEIHDRYGPGHLVSRSIQRATPMILRAVEQVHDRSARERIAPQTRKRAQCYGRPSGLLHSAEPLVPTNVPTGLACRRNQASELEPRYGIEP